MKLSNEAKEFIKSLIRKTEPMGYAVEYYEKEIACLESEKDNIEERINRTRRSIELLNNREKIVNEIKEYLDCTD